MPFTIPTGFFGGGSSGGIANPLALSGCVCWLRSDLGVTNGGNNWADQSGNGANAVGDTSWTAVGSINGRPSIIFPSPGYLLALNLALQGAKTVAMVYKLSATYISSYTAQSLYVISYPNSPSITSASYGFTVSGATGLFFPNDVGSTLVNGIESAGVNYDTNPYKFITTYNGSGGTSTGSYTSSVNGTNQTVVTSGQSELNTTYYQSVIGTWVNPGTGVANPFIGEVCEFIVYSRALNSTEVGQLNTYLYGLYNI